MLLLFPQDTFQFNMLVLESIGHPVFRLGTVVKPDCKFGNSTNMAATPALNLHLNTKPLYLVL